MTDSRSLLGFGFLVTGLLLLLVLLVSGDLRHHLEVLELVNKESSHDSVLNLGSGKVATVWSSHGFMADAHSLQVVGSTGADTLHSSDLGLLLEEVHDEFAT